MRRIAVSICLVISMLVTASCWSQREIEDLGFVLGIGIAKTELGLYSVTFQIANPGAIAAENPDQREIYSILKSEGISKFDAIRNLSSEAGRRLFLAHVQTVVIEDSVAREGLAEIMSFLLQDMEVRIESVVFISKIPPEEILDTPNTLGIIPATFLQILAENYGVNSKVYVSTLHQTIEAANNPTINYVTSLVEIIPAATDKEMDFLKLTKLAIFDDATLVGYVDYEEGQGFNLITNNFLNGLIVFDCQHTGDKITIEMTESSSKVTPSYSKGKVSFLIELTAAGNVAERTNQSHRMHELKIEDVQKQLDTVLEAKMRRSIATAQNEFKIDYFNLGNHFFRKYPKEFKELQENWNEVFANAEISVKAESTINHSALNRNRGRI